MDPAGNIQIISEILEEVKNEKSHNWFYDFKVFWFNGAGASFVAEEKERDQWQKAEEEVTKERKLRKEGEEKAKESEEKAKKIEEIAEEKLKK